MAKTSRPVRQGFSNEGTTVIGCIDYGSVLVGLLRLPMFLRIR